MAPADLAGVARQVMVRQVGMQGLEELTPLIFFEGVARPLALDHDQRVAMSRIARSHLLADWVGAALVLRPVREQGRETIRLHDLEERRAVYSRLPLDGWQAAAPVAGRLLGRTLVVLLVVALAFAAVMLVESMPSLEGLTSLFSR